MRSHWLLVLAVPFFAGCGGSGSHPISLTPASDPGTSTPTASSVSPSPCTTSDLDLHLGAQGAAAGSTYAPIVFTNTSAAACTLSGYPGVSYAASDGGSQIGAAATRDSVHAATPVTLQPGGSAAALVRMANYANYPDATCDAATVGGLRVYPPGSKKAAFVAFSTAQKACSSDVDQLAVAAVVAGTSGQ
jgi:hypothetical protein